MKKTIRKVFAIVMCMVTIFTFAAVSYAAVADPGITPYAEKCTVCGTGNLVYTLKYTYDEDPTQNAHCVHGFNFGTDKIVKTMGVYNVVCNGANCTAKAFNVTKLVKTTITECHGYN